MSYWDNSRELMQSAAFREKLRFSIRKVATQVAGEDESAFGVNQAIKRQALAFASLVGGSVNGTVLTPDNVLDCFKTALAALEVMNHAEVQTVLDSVYDAAVSSVWDDIAGATSSDKIT